MIYLFLRESYRLYYTRYENSPNAKAIPLKSYSGWLDFHLPTACPRHEFSDENKQTWQSTARIKNAALTPHLSSFSCRLPVFKLLPMHDELSANPHI